MKVAILTAVTLSLGGMGVQKMYAARAAYAAPAASAVAAEQTTSAVTAAPAAGARPAACWSDAKIKKSRFSLRGEAGGIRSFEVDRTAGCEFRVKIEYTSPSGANKTLDYDAKYIRGTSPIFVRYNTPP